MLKEHTEYPSIPSAKVGEPYLKTQHGPNKASTQATDLFTSKKEAF